MSHNIHRKRCGFGTKSALCGLGLLATLGLTGCQVSVGGQTLPSPWYVSDDVQYFPSGPEFILQNEADFIASQNAPAGAAAGREVGQRPAGMPTRR
jgi:hypothetical protein